MNIRKSMGMLLCLCSLAATAQEAWDIDRCMAYAVEHNRTVKQRKLESDNYKIEAIGQFLPGVSGSVSAQYSYGRSVDPGTNTYISQSHLHLTIYVQQRLCHGRLDAYLSGRKPYQPSAAGKSERTVRQSRPAGSERQYRTRNLPGIHRRSLLLRNDPPGRTEAGRKRLISLQDPTPRSVGTERHGGRGTNGSPASHRCLQPDPSAQPL